MARKKHLRNVFQKKEAWQKDPGAEQFHKTVDLRMGRSNSLKTILLCNL